MPGVPKSLSCEGCRKRKKACDQAKPKCGRCTHLDIPCVGNGVRRYKWLPSEQVAPSPKRSPSSDLTRENSNLIYILDIEDLRYDMRAYGGTFFSDLPRRVGHSTVFDASVSALIASYNAYQFNQSKLKAFDLYGRALKTLRESLQDETQPIGMKMYAIYNIYVCQPTGKHMEMLSLMLQDVVAQGKLKELEYVYGLCQHIAWQGLLNPKVRLGPWFWEAACVCTTTRPLRYQKHDFLSLDLGTRAEISFYLQAPAQYFYQIQCIYDLIRLEKPRLHQTVDMLRMAAFAPNANLMDMKVLISYQSGYATLLAMRAVLNRVLRAFRHQEANLLTEAHELCDQAVILAARCIRDRPFAAAYVPEVLKALWASSTDNYGCAKLEALLLDFQKDFEGADYLREAMLIRERLENMERDITPTEYRESISLAGLNITARLDQLASTDGCAPQ